MKHALSRPLSRTLLKLAAVAAVPAMLLPFAGCADNDTRVDERRLSPRDDTPARPLGVETDGRRVGEPVPAASERLSPSSDPIRINDGPATPGSNGTVAPQSGTGDSNDRPTRPGSSPPGTYAEPRSDVTAPSPQYQRQPVYDPRGVVIPGESATVIVPVQPQGNQPITNQPAGNQPVGGTTSNGQPIYQGLGEAPAGQTQQPGTPATPQQPIRQQLPPVPVTSNKLPPGSTNTPNAQPAKPISPNANSTFNNAPPSPAKNVGLQPGQNTQDTSRNGQTPAAATEARNQSSSDNRNNSGNSNRTNNNQNNQGNNGSSSVPRGGSGAPAGGTGAPAGGTGAPAGGSGSTGGSSGGSSGGGGGQ